MTTDIAPTPAKEADKLKVEDEAKNEDGQY